MEDTDANDFSLETLEKQFDTVKTETAQSHVMEFGETDFKTMVIGDFEGDLDITSSFFNRLMMKAVSDKEVKKTEVNKHMSAVSSRDAHLNHLYAKTLTDGSHKAHIDLSTEINHRMKADHIFEQFAGISDSANGEEDTPLPRNFDCLRNMISLYEEHCEKFSDYSLKYVKYLVRDCEKYPESIDASMHRLKAACQH